MLIYGDAKNANRGHKTGQIVADRIYVYRTQGRRGSDGGSRDIMARLHYHQECVEILWRVRSSGAIHLKESSMFIAADYTPGMVMAQAAFTLAKRLLENQPGVWYGLLFPARLCIAHGGTDKVFVNSNKAMEHIKKKNIPSTGGENQNKSQDRPLSISSFY